MDDRYRIVPQLLATAQVWISTRHNWARQKWKKARVAVLTWIQRVYPLKQQQKTLTQANKRRYHFDYIYASKQQCNALFPSRSWEETESRKVWVDGGRWVARTRSSRELSPRGLRQKRDDVGVVNYFIWRTVACSKHKPHPAHLSSIFFLFSPSHVSEMMRQ